MKLSVCILTLNNESTIKKCLDSVIWADEIVVGVDDLSTDKTEEICKKYSQNVFRVKHRDSFDLNKNLVIAKARNEWVLWLDGDEWMEEDLNNEIGKVVDDKNFDVYKIPRKNIVFDKWIAHTGWYPDYQIRLFKKSTVKFSATRLHQHPEVQGKIGRLNNHIIHNNYQSISQFILRLDKYTSVEAENRNEKLEAVDFIKVPFNEFLKRFLVNKGYKDGWHGLILSILQSFYEFVVIVKIWEKKGFSNNKVKLKEIESQLKEGLSNWQWWKYEAKIKEAKSKTENLWLKSKRRLGW